MAQPQIAAVVGHLLLRSDESTSDLAAVLGVSEKTVKRRLAGSQEWTATEIAQLAQHFNVPVAILFAGPDALFAAALTDEGRVHLKWLTRSAEPVAA